MAAQAEIDLSCRLPLLVLFISAAVWLVIGSGLALLASLQFHSADFLASFSWLTYGRVRPAYLDSVLYGFCLQAGLGVALWLFARLGSTTLAQRWLVIVGAKLWNLGVAVGVLGILAGDSTGFENLELPPYAGALMFLGYLMVGVCGLLTFHRRRERGLFVPQWFLFAAIFWFPWIYSTAYLLLVTYPVRGVAQAVIAWWYSQNLLAVWLGLAGIGAVFYFVPKLTQRDLHSRYLGMFAFWTLILFASWGGVPNTAPVPAWMPALSTVTTVLTALPLLAVVLNVWRTVKPSVADGKSGTNREAEPEASPTPLNFILFGVAAFAVVGLLKISAGLLDTNQTLHFTWFVPAVTQLYFYGFFIMVMSGAIYYILPQLVGTQFSHPKLVRMHFWLSVLGILLVVLPLVVAGVVQALQLQDSAVPFPTIMKTMLHFLRVSTLGDLLLFAGNLVFLGNLLSLVLGFYRAHAATNYKRATANLFETREAAL